MPSSPPSSTHNKSAATLRGFDTEKSGLLLIAVFAPVSGALADRLGTRWLASAGMAIMCSGLVLLSQIDDRSSELDIVWRLLVIGFGVALFESPNNSALLGRPTGPPQDCLGRACVMSSGWAEPQHRARGRGVPQGGRLTGQPSPSPCRSESNRAAPGSAHLAFRTTFLTCAAVAAIGVVTSLIRWREDRPGQKPSAELRSR